MKQNPMTILIIEDDKEACNEFINVKNKEKI